MKQNERGIKRNPLDNAVIEGMVRQMRRRAMFRLVLLSVFLLNAIAAGVFMAYVIWQHTPSPSFLVPALSAEGLSLLFLVFLWSGSNRRRRLARASTRPASEFLAGLLAETRATARERRMLVLTTAFVLTPLFLLATGRQVSGGQMSAGNALTVVLAYCVCLAVILIVSLQRMRQLRPRQFELEGMLGQLRDVGLRTRVSGVESAGR